MSGLSSKEYKELRFETSDKEIPRRLYNAIIGVLTLCGIISNIACCALFSKYVMTVKPWVVLIGFIVGVFASMFLIYKSKSVAVNVFGFFLLTAVMGILVSLIAPYYPLPLVLKAFAITALIVGIMIIASITFPNLFLSLGRALFTSLLIFIIIEVLAYLLLGLDTTFFDIVAVLIFSLYIGYDWAKSQKYPPTVKNAVGSAADIYVDIVNIFVRVLNILSRKD